MATLIPLKEYKRIVASMPIACVDLIISRGWNDDLLVKRKNAPLKGKWWVPGGRILLNETPAQAAVRKAKEEVGLDVPEMWFIGYFSGIFQEGQCVSLVFRVEVPDFKVKLDSQSSAYKWGKLPKDFKIVGQRVMW